jgi:hypothetical protein
MKWRFDLCLFLVICLSQVKAQVQVSREPYHRKVLENEYVRLLDVWLPPGDTTGYHVHSTPSFFLFFTQTKNASQVKGGEWVHDLSAPGKPWYRSFRNDTLVHRVANIDTGMMHVTDVEMLKPFSGQADPEMLPFAVLFQEDRVVAYRLTSSDITGKNIRNRGPIVAELVTGDPIVVHDADQRKAGILKPGGYLYIPPGSTFYLSGERKSETNLILFEIR